MAYGRRKTVTLFGPRFADYVKRTWPWMGRSVCYKRGAVYPAAESGYPASPRPLTLERTITWPMNRTFTSVSAGQPSLSFISTGKSGAPGAKICSAISGWNFLMVSQRHPRTFQIDPLPPSAHPER